jgi:predicted secreted protein
MANEVAGIDILVYINMTDSPAPEDWVILGGQRGVTLRKVTEVADARHKSSGKWPNRVQTFLDWSVTGDMVKITADPTQIRLNALWRASQDVHVRVLKEDGDAERGFAVIGDLSEGAPHNDVATLALDFQGNSELEAVEPS